MRRNILKTLVAGAAGFALTLAAAGGAMAQDEAPIRIGWTAWSDAEAVTRLAERVIEERYDQPVELVLADIGLQYQGVAQGDLDAMMMAWLPLTHASYMEKLGDQMVSLGILYTRARLGWVVPTYVPEDQVSSIADLAKPEVREKLGARIQGIDPGAGLMQASEEAIEQYGLDDYELVSASGAAMTAAIKRAVDRNEWIVATGWSPHWKFAKWDLRYLEDPEGALGGLERIHVMARQGFYQDHPEIAEFLSRMYLPLDELEAIMFEASETSYEEAVEAYVADHGDRIDYWVTGKLSSP